MAAIMRLALVFGPGWPGEVGRVVRGGLGHGEAHEVRRRVVVAVGKRDGDDRFAVADRVKLFVGGAVFEGAAVGFRARLREHVFDDDEIFRLAELRDVVAVHAALGDKAGRAS